MARQSSRLKKVKRELQDLLGSSGGSYSTTEHPEASILLESSFILIAQHKHKTISSPTPLPLLVLAPAGGKCSHKARNTSRRLITLTCEAHPTTSYI